MTTATPPPPAPAPSQRARFLVLAGLGLLALLSIPVCALRGRSDPAEARVHADFATLLDALARYRADHPILPGEGSLDFLVPRYLPAVPVDPWGQPYQYASNEARVVLITLGRDGVRGGVGPDQDHTNHDGHQR